MTINLNDLDDDQRIAATAPRGPVAILAGAGTGKTRTITYRIAHLIEQGHTSGNNVLAVTFTTRAASEMRHRINQMGYGGVQARTFHSAANRQLRYFWPQVFGDLPWRLEQNKFPFVARAVRSLGLDTAKESVRDILSEIEWAKASLIAPDAYVERAGERKLPAPADKIAEAYRRYEQSKTTPEGVICDFDDLILQTAAVLENSSAIAEEFRAQYRTFVVDEYQDVTPLQQRLLDAWLGERDDITVVGDANQTIYSFTGATPSYLLDFSRKYPHATVARLQRDYRSTPQVTDLANAVIDKATGRAAGTRLTLQGMRPKGPTPEFHEYPDEAAEARGTAAKIKTLLDQGIPAHEIAVLFRMNSQSVTMEEALRDQGIVYQVRGGEQFFDRPEITQAISAMARTFNSGRVKDGVNLGELVRAILAPLGLTPHEPEGNQARERWQSLQALANLCDDLATSIEGLDLAGLLTKLQERKNAKHPPNMEGVTLASIHAAKGLEWDAVFLIGLTEGTLPIGHAIKAGAEQIEEERRLFYVGITRAREHLYHSWAKARQEGGKATRKRTRFLDGILGGNPQGTAPRRARRHIRCSACGTPLITPTAKVLGRCEDCPSTAGEGVFDALKAWRLDTAKEMGVPAFVVFTDATLMAVAEAMPQTPGDLLKISGIGKVKADQFGPGVLETLAQFQ